MEEVAPEHDIEQSSEEYVANAVACNGDEAAINRITATMVGSMEPVLPDLIAHRLVQKKGSRIEMLPLARVMAEHFIGIERLLEIIRLTGKMEDPLDIIGELESDQIQKETAKAADKKKQQKCGHGRR
jgi:helicase